MIQINLLPQDNITKAAKGSSSGPNQSSIVVTAVLLFAYIIVLGIGIYFYTDLISVQTQARAKTAEAKKLEDELKIKREEFKEISAQLDDLKAQVTLLNALDPQENRLFWAEKLNLLPELMPEGVFLTQLNVVEDVRQKETKASVEAYENWKKLPVKTRPKEAPKKEFYPEIRYTLSMNGIAYVEDGTDDKLVELVIAFHNRMKSESVSIPFNGKKTVFIENFKDTIRISPMTRTTMDNRAVYQFNFVLETNPTKAPTIDIGT